MLIRSKENTFTARFHDADESVFLKGITLLEILEFARPPDIENIVLAKVNNRVVNLRSTLEEDCLIEWVSLGTAEAEKAYRQSVVLVFLRAAQEMFPNQRFQLASLFGDAMIWAVRGKRSIHQSMIKKIRSRMNEIIQRDEVLEPVVWLRNQAMEFFHKMGDRSPLIIENEETARLTIYQCGTTQAYLDYPTFSSTTHLDKFLLERYRSGMILSFSGSSSKNAYRNSTFKRRLRVSQEFNVWRQLVGVRDIASLNDALRSKKADDLIQVSDGIHAQKIDEIARLIQQKRNRYRVIILLGAAGSGHSAIAHHLAIQLRILGLLPVQLSMKDYYLQKDDHPVETDQPKRNDFPCVLDLSHMNDNIRRLIKGETVQLPEINEETQKRVLGPGCILGPKQPIIVVGCNDQFEKIAPKIARINKMYIYVEPFTQLRITSAMRVHPRDIRLLRQLTYRLRFLGLTLENALTLQASMHSDYPQCENMLENCDVIFNTSLVYELGVFRSILLPLLESCPESCNVYPEVQRLIDLMRNVHPVSPHSVPSCSIMREFIGSTRWDASRDLAPKLTN